MSRLPRRELRRAYVGSGGPRFFLALSPNDPQPNKAFLVVNTQESDQIEVVMVRTERFIIEEIPEASGRADVLFLGPAALGTVELQIIGPDINTLRRLECEADNYRLFFSIAASISNCHFRTPAA